MSWLKGSSGLEGLGFDGFRGLGFRGLGFFRFFRV